EVADGNLGAKTAGTEPAGARPGHAITPYLVVETDAEHLVVAGDDGLEIALGERPRALRPDPDAAIGALEKDDVVGGVVVADRADGNLAAITVGAAPAVFHVVLPHLTVVAHAEHLVVAGHEVG